MNTAIAPADEPGDWGIVGVANRSRRVVDALKEQDFIYSILQLVPDDESVRLVDAVAALDPAPSGVQFVSGPQPFG